MKSPTTLIAALACLLLPLIGTANELDRRLSLADQRADITSALEAIKAHHPNYGLYAGESSLDALFDQALVAGEPGATVRSFAARLRRLVAQLGDGHSCVDFSPSYLAAIAPDALLPFDLSIVEQTVILDAVAPGISLDSELIALDGIPALDLLSEAAALSCVDGANPRAALSMAARQFAYINYFLRPLDQPIVLSLRSPDGTERDLTLSFADNGHWLLDDPTDTAAPWPAFFVATKRFDHPALQLNRQGPAPLLIVGDFFMDERRFASELAVAFAAIPKGSEDLIIDLRGNSGGLTSNASKLLSYLIDGSHYMPRYYHVTETPFDEALPLTLAMHSGATTVRRARERANAIKSRFGAMSSRELAQPSGFLVPVAPVSPDLDDNLETPRPFSGRLHVLIDEATASAANVFASQLRRSRQDVVLYGTPSSGNAARGCSRSPFSLTLPASGLQLELSWLCFVLDSDASSPTDQLAPDHPQPQTLRDMRLGRDSALEFVQERIRNGSSFN